LHNLAGAILYHDYYSTQQGFPWSARPTSCAAFWHRLALCASAILQNICFSLLRVRKTEEKRKDNRNSLHFAANKAAEIKKHRKKTTHVDFILGEKTTVKISRCVHL
jgi:hypothetical protein